MHMPIQIFFLTILASRLASKNHTTSLSQQILFSFFLFLLTKEYTAFTERRLEHSKFSSDFK